MRSGFKGRPGFTQTRSLTPARLVGRPSQPSPWTSAVQGMSMWRRETGASWTPGCGSRTPPPSTSATTVITYSPYSSCIPLISRRGEGEGRAAGERA